MNLNDSSASQPTTSSNRLKRVMDINVTPSSTIKSIDFSPDSMKLVVVDNHYAHLYNIKTGELLLTSEDLAITCAAYSPDGLVVALGHEEGAISVWTPEQRQRLWRSLTAEERKWAITFWTKEEQKGLVSILPHTDLVKGLQYSPDGSLLASCSSDGTLNLWDLPSNTHRKILSPEREAFEAAVKLGIEVDEDLIRGPFSSIILSPNGKLIAGSSYDERENEQGKIVTVGSVTLWEVETGRKYLTLETNNYYYRISYSADGSLVAGGSADGAIHIWSTLTGELIKSLGEGKSHILGIAFGPGDGILVAGDKQGSLTVWDIDRGIAVTTINEQGGAISVVQFSPDGTLLASATRNGRITLWRIEGS